MWTLGPVGVRLPNLRVRRVAPAAPADPWVYVTIGAWASTAEHAHGYEFVLVSPDENPLHVELLAMVAYFHSDARYRLDVGSTMDIGRPWAEGSAADHLLVALPYPFGPTLEDLRVADRHVRFLWLVPITNAEAQFVGSKGLEAFEELLERSLFDVADPLRPAVVA